MNLQCENAKRIGIITWIRLKTKHSDSLKAEFGSLFQELFVPPAATSRRKRDPPL